MSSAGMVTPTPKAMLSPALPAVWVMLFSRIVARLVRKTLLKPRKMVMESTATGMEALTVRPTLSTRYMLEAPKRMPSSAPTISGTGVSSGMSRSAEMKGWWATSSADTGTRSAVAVRGAFDSGAFSNAGICIGTGQVAWSGRPVTAEFRVRVSRRILAGVFSVKLVARPDARMVEVPLEIEAELPREFEGVALLAASGLPRKVKIKAVRDALKLSTAYRTDQLLGDIVRSTLRGTAQDVERVQEAVTRFVRTLRERRQDGATLLVSSNGRGEIQVGEQLPGRTAHPAPRPPISSIPPPPDRGQALEWRIAQLEAAVGRAAAVGDSGERVAALEQRVAA